MDISSLPELEKLYLESFSAEERTPFDKLMTGKFKNFSMLAVYKQDTLIALIHVNNSDDFLYINYFAVKKKLQDRYGSQILTKLKQEYDKPIVLDVEEIDEKTTDNETKRRRKNFYLKNGFQHDKYSLFWIGNHMTYMYYGNIDEHKYLEYLNKTFVNTTNIQKRDED